MFFTFMTPFVETFSGRFCQFAFSAVFSFHTNAKQCIAKAAILRDKSSYF